MTQLQLNNQAVSIDKGQLSSYKKDDHEYIHQVGSPGWGKSDDEMFPVIGPTDEAHFKVQTPKGEAILDQHGLLRELTYKLTSSTETSAVFEKTYKAETKVKNSKFPKKSTEEWLSWPYDFVFKKQFKLSENELKIEFIISGEKGMPFMLGYHPAFKLHTETPIVQNAKKEISLEEIMAVGSRAYQVPDCSEISLRDDKNITLKSEGFGNFMLWTEVTNMLCIEPISFYPYAVKQENLHEGFQTLNNGEVRFTVKLKLN
ncbi:galactose mutarotase-like enzyme [Leeuwenhoekiella aestuarii]|uniref:Galactose mutarotase-like enzyme n=1 Tax=Leeuwenhoekiella aestuarii TaxID=2249426 RepID=A0A4Q0NWN7_9FLAO|nr:aldose 1-epimerase [Leeuwenhoekiella aestuarii]RXG15912.1 galactose mutarotase-like enzyme [Leeuwenhoekiella aestuarii]RXG16606.1 galactose mutarotase-like enzyme [Leeuwenhoekiella aestuarii]